MEVKRSGEIQVKLHTNKLSLFLSFQFDFLNYPGSQAGRYSASLLSLKFYPHIPCRMVYLFLLPTYVCLSLNRPLNLSLSHLVRNSLCVSSNISASPSIVQMYQGPTFTSLCLSFLSTRFSIRLRRSPLLGLKTGPL